MLSKIVGYLSWLFVFLLPWQTRLVWQWGTINGAPWEFGTYSLYGTEILLWSVVILFFVEKFRKKEFREKITSQAHFKTHKYNLFFGIGFIGFLALEILHSQNIELSYNYTLFLLGAICFSLVILEIGNLGHWVGLWLGGVVQGLFALGQFFLQTVSGNKWLGLATHLPGNIGASVVEFGDERWLRAYGSFGSPNSLGIFLAVCLILGILLYLKLENQKYKILITLGQVIITAGLVLSFSRSAWFAVMCGLVAVFILNVRQSNRLDFIKQLFFIIAPALCLFVIFQPVFLARFNSQNRLEYKSVTERHFQYIEFKNVFIEHPWFGVGPGAYTVALSKIEPENTGYNLQPVHNIYVLVLAEWGIIGGLVWLLFFVFLGRIVYKINRVFFPTILILLVAGLFDHWSISMYTGLVLWWLIWGVGLKKI